jgi:hypothetical protein
MPQTNEQINALIAFNLPDNNQQLISPSKVREVLLSMQDFSNANIYVPTDTLQSVTDRGAATNKTLTVAGMSIGNSGFFATVGAATLAANRTVLLPNENGTLLTNNSALDATKVSGVLDPANIPLMYSGVQVVSSGGIADLTTLQQAQVSRGSIVTTTDGRRWTYTGSGSKTDEASYIIVADVTPEWSVIAGKPSTFTPSAHGHSWSDITTDLPTTAAGYGITDAVVTGGSYSNPSWLTGLAWSKLSGVPSTFTPSAHSHAWSDITSGLPTTLAGYGITNGQVTLVSGTNIKTINGNSLLGSGDLAIGGSASAAGSNNQIQYNSGGSFAASADFTWDNTGKVLITQFANTGWRFSQFVVNLANQSCIHVTGVTAGSTNYLLTANNAGTLVNVNAVGSSGFVGIGANNAVTLLVGASNVSIGTINQTGARLDVAGGVSGSAATALISATQTWNTTGSPTAFLLNVTNTASGASANLMDLQVGGTSQFKVSKAGAITTASPSGAAAAWKLGRYLTVSSVSHVSNRCVLVDIDGQIVYLGVVA